MHKIKIQVVQLEVTQGLIEAHRDVFWGMMGTPQLEKLKHSEININIQQRDA